MVARSGREVNSRKTYLKLTPVPPVDLGGREVNSSLPQVKKNLPQVKKNLPQKSK